MAYVEVETLARLLHVDATGRAEDLEAAINAASVEIDHWLGGTPEVDFSGDEAKLALLREVNIDRAMENWEHLKFGVLGLGSETGAVFTAKDPFDRHAKKLAPLKVEFGLA